MVVRLSGARALSLHTHRSTPAHSLALVVLEASDRLSHQRLHRLLATSLPRMARFRSRLVPKPLGAGQPMWAEIDDYDPAPQIQCATVPSPGGRQDFADLVADLITRRPDRRDRLWEAWTIDGLKDGRWALAVRMSPALDDGAGGFASVWPRLLTGTPRADPAKNLPAEPSLGSAPSAGEVVTDLLSEVAENYVTGGWLLAEAVSGALNALHTRLFGRNGRAPMVPAAASMPVPHTVLNAPLTRRRTVAFASLPLPDVKMISNAFGGSATNVVLAACTLSLRAWLQRHDTVPDHPLLMRMPLELPAGGPATSSKTLTVGQLRIPVHIDDPVQVLANLHTATEMLNNLCGHYGERQTGTIDLDAMKALVPPVVTFAGMQLLRRSGLRRHLKPSYHGSVSYLASTPAPAYCAGVKVVGMHSVAALSEECGLTIALTSRGEVLDVSVCACPDNVPAVDDLATGIGESLEVLLVAARESPRGQGPSVVTEMTSHPANRSGIRPFL